MATKLEDLNYVINNTRNTNVVEIAVPLAAASADKITALFTLKVLSEDVLKVVRYPAEKKAGGVVLNLTTDGQFYRFHETDYLVVSGVNDVRVITEGEYISRYTSALLNQFDIELPRVNRKVPLKDGELEAANAAAGGAAASGPKSPKSPQVGPGVGG